MTGRCLIVAILKGRSLPSIFNGSTVCSRSRTGRSSIASLRLSDCCKMMLGVEWLSSSLMYCSQSSHGYLFFSPQKASVGLTCIQMRLSVIIFINTICCCSTTHLPKYITKRTNKWLIRRAWNRILEEIRGIWCILKEIHKQENHESLKW